MDSSAAGAFVEPPGKAAPSRRLGVESVLVLAKALLAGWLKDRKQNQWRLHMGSASRASKESAPVLQSASARPLSVSGVYTPQCSIRQMAGKNWVDLVTAFCWAFKDREDAPEF